MKTSWDFDDDTIYDAEGNEAAIRPGGSEDDFWEATASSICDAMNRVTEASK